jgi:hypothetical protein
MTNITDVLAFSVQNADYWTDLLSGGSYPSELTEAETRALEAARGHIEAVVVELLHAAGSKLAETLGAERMQMPRFKGASTAKNRSVSLPPPNDLVDQMYRIEFSLEPADDSRTIVLYASLVVKKGAQQGLREELAARAIKHAVDDYHVYAPGIALKEGSSVEALASEAATAAATLLTAFNPAPKGGTGAPP